MFRIRRDHNHGPSSATPVYRRNRAEFLEGREAIEAFLTRKWAHELDYRLVKELWAFGGNRIAVRFTGRSGLGRTSTHP